MSTINTQVIKLQSIVLKNCMNNNESKLYSSTLEGDALIHDGKIQIQDKSKVSFFSYFNSFSVQKWSRYTNITDIYINFFLKGIGKITIYNTYLENNKINKKIICSEEFSFDDYKELKIDINNIPMYKGSIYFEITSLDGEVILLKAEYYGKIHISQINETILRLVICTYKREAYIMRNLKLLESTLKSEESVLNKKLKIYVIDNGNTLGRLENNYFKIVPNKNLGGSGGFTRGLVELVESKEFYSHAILMDDDVEILPEALERLHNFLSVLKDEYKSSIISGSMLQLDKKHILHESTGRFIGRGFEPVNYKLDLTLEYNILLNETEQDISNQFAAWWFCCIPKLFIRSDNLPFPFFIKGDDVEYSLRNTDSIIHLNGIGIWHEPFEKKYAQVNTFYYEIRNFLIITSLYFKNYNKFEAIKFILERYARESLRYRYKSSDLIIEAVNDFLKGPKFFSEVNEEEKHKYLTDKCYKLINIEEIQLKYNISSEKLEEECNNSQNEDNRKSRLKRILTINGYILPKLFTNKQEYKYKIVPLTSSRHINYYKNTEILNVLLEDNSGFVTQRSRVDFIKDTYRVILVCIKVLFKYDKIKKQYNKNSRLLTTEDFWKSKF